MHACGLKRSDSDVREQHGASAGHGLLGPQVGMAALTLGTAESRARAASAAAEANERPMATGVTMRTIR